MKRANPIMLCTENMDRFCGCLTRPQMVPHNPDKPFLAPSLAQNCNSMIKTVIPRRANWRMSFLIAFRTIRCLIRNPFFAIDSNLLFLTISSCFFAVELLDILPHSQKSILHCLGEKLSIVRELPENRCEKTGILRS